MVPQQTPTPTKAKPSRTTPEVRTLRGLVEGFHEQVFALFPEQGSAVGRHEFDAALSRPGPAVWEKYQKLVREHLARVEDLPLTRFSGAEALERRAFLSLLRTEYVNHIQLGRWRNNPQILLHDAADAIFSLLVRNADDLSPVAEAIVARLKAMPKYYAAAQECVTRPEPLWQRLTVQAAPGVEALFKSLPQPLAEATGKSRAIYERIAAAACTAVRDFAKHVEQLEPAAAGSFSLGHDLFALRMREQIGLDWTPREAAALGRARAAELKVALTREARRLHGRKSADELIAEGRAAWSPRGGNLLEEYQRVTLEMRERFEAAGWMSFPKGEKLVIKAVPAFMRDLIPTAAYSSPGALDHDQTGIFWVNDPADAGLTVEKAVTEMRQHFGLELTCAHEAYPGHHLQFIIQNRIPGLARKVVHHAVFYEGWTLWCEQMTADLLTADGGKEHPYLRLQQLHDELWRAWRIVIDVGLHTGELDYNGAVRLLRRELGFTKARAQAEINWYSSAPTVPMSYLIGKWEVLRLKCKHVDEGGRTMRQFNDWMLSFGAIPWRWIEESGL